MNIRFSIREWQNCLQFHLGHPLSSELDVEEKERLGEDKNVLLIKCSYLNLKIQNLFPTHLVCLFFLTTAAMCSY